MSLHRGPKSREANRGEIAQQAHDVSEVIFQQRATRLPLGQLRVTLIPQYRRAPGYFRQPEASPLATSRDDRALRAWPRAAFCLPELRGYGLVWSWSSLLIPNIDAVNIHLTGVAFAGSCIFTLSTF